jgi:uncharacterized protein (DUF1697 family)
MALFKRADLKAKGLNDEQIEFVMTESGRALSDYELKSNIQSQIDAAVEAAKGAPAEVNVLESTEYKALLAQNQKLEAFQTDDFAVVKAPYKDMVWEKLDHAEKHAPYAEQLSTLAETMPDLFVQTQEEPQKTPQFGAGTQGTMPTGKKVDSFADIWGYNKK